MDAFPAFFPLIGARVVIAGEDESAEAKARLFEGSPADIVRLDAQAALDPAAYAGATLVFVASFDAAFAKAAASAARGCGAPLNVVDRPELSDFHTPAVVDRGQVVAAIGTAGAAPLLASLLRAEIETRVPAGAGRIAALLGDQREPLRKAFPDFAHRRAFLRAMLIGPVADAAAAGDEALAARLLSEAIAAGWSAVGRVSLIEAPVALDLISVRAVRALNIADVVVSGLGAAPLLASHARRDAEYLSPADADAAMLSELAHAGRIVAVVSRTPDPALGRALAALGVVVERLEAARAP
jgi:precorrin-2 dehydrogenase/sirohydrochlorin ferrochelatase